MNRSENTSNWIILFPCFKSYFYFLHARNNIFEQTINLPKWLMYAQSYKTPYMTNRWCPSIFGKWIRSSILALDRHQLFLALSEECRKILSNEIKLRSGRDESWNYFKREKLIFVLVINLFFLFTNDLLQEKFKYLSIGKHPQKQGNRWLMAMPYVISSQIKNQQAGNSSE